MTQRICALMLILACLGCEERKVVVPKSNGEAKSVSIAETYKVEMGDLAVGDQTAEVVLQSKSPFKINPNYPWKFTFDDAAVTTKVVEGQVDSEDGTKTGDIIFEGKQARIPISINAAQAGELEIKAIGSFSTCEPGDNGKCYFARDEPVTLKVAVK